MGTTLALEYVTLIDNFPGYPDLRAPEPQDGFTGARHFNVTSPTIYDIGTKIQVWDSVSNGPVICCYLQNANLGTAPVATTAGRVCHPHTTQWAVSTDPDDSPAYSLAKGQVAIALGVIAVSSYGFYWVGGVCPQDTKFFASSLAAVTVTTDDSVVLTAGLMPYDATAKLGLKIHTGDVLSCGNSSAAD